LGRVHEHVLMTDSDNASLENSGRLDDLVSDQTHRGKPVCGHINRVRVLEQTTHVNSECHVYLDYITILAYAKQSLASPDVGSQEKDSTTTTHLHLHTTIPRSCVRSVGAQAFVLWCLS
jgi:hypothetical protein